jgi:hypothetical protein
VRRGEMNATRKRSLWMVAVGLAAALALTFTPIGSAQAVVDAGGTADGAGTYISGGIAVTVDVAGTPQLATGPVTYTDTIDGQNFTGVALCIAIDETPTGFRASIAGAITGGTLHTPGGYRGFELTVYDNTPFPPETDQISVIALHIEERMSCAFDFDRDFTLTAGDFTVTPAGATVCPPNDDDDGDGLTNHNENLFSTLLGKSDSDFDGIADGNDDANRNGEDDEDEDDDENGNNGCPDEDSDDDGEDDEDEDDDDDDNDRGDGDDEDDDDD